MANPTNKQELLAAIADGYAKLCDQMAKMSDLHEWQVLMREFVQNIREGHPRDYLPDEYRHNYHEMDKMLVEKHQGTPLEDADRLLRQTHEEMLSLADSFTDEELFTKGFCKNTYTTTMAAYFVSVTSSPYGQAVKLLKTHQKNCRK